MPSKRYAVEPGGPQRVEVSWGFARRNTVVVVDGQEVGRFADAQALRQGGSFPLPDGSTLTVGLGGGLSADLLLARDGVPLPGSGGDPRQRLRNAAVALWFIAGISIVIGLLATVGGVNALQAIGFGTLSIAFGAVFAILGFLVTRGSLIALIAAMVLFGVDTVLVVLAVVETGGTGIGSLIVRVLVFLFLFQAIPAARQLRQPTTDLPAPPAPPPPTPPPPLPPASGNGM